MLLIHLNPMNLLLALMVLESFLGAAPGAGGSYQKDEKKDDHAGKHYVLVEGNWHWWLKQISLLVVLLYY